MDIWEKYKKENEPTICIIGILILSAKICEADGHFSQLEKDEILKILPHDPEQETTILEILKEAVEDKNDILYHARKIKKNLINHQDFLEFIIAVLYRLAHSDSVYSKEEDIVIKQVAEIFEVKPSLFDTLFRKLKFYILKLTNNKNLETNA